MELEISYEEETIGINAEYAWGRALRCPHCKDPALIHYGFTSYNRHDENKNITHVVDAGSVAFDYDGTIFTPFNQLDIEEKGLVAKDQLSSRCQNPSGSQDGMVIKFWCKNCCKVSLLCIARHGNVSLIKWRKISAIPVKKKRKKIKPGVRFDVLKRDNYTCQTCGATAQDGATLEIDHIRPFSKGGSDEIDNLQVLCRDCNIGKGNKDQ